MCQKGESKGVDMKRGPVNGDAVAYRHVQPLSKAFRGGDVKSSRTIVPVPRHFFLRFILSTEERRCLS